MTRLKAQTNPSLEGRLLTEVEFEMMAIIWERGESTVKDVLDALPKSRDLAYTSVATFLKILEKKGFLSTQKNDRAHVYYPLILKSNYESTSVNNLVDKLFSGTTSSLVVKLLNESELTLDELKSIRNILNERIKQ